MAPGSGFWRPLSGGGGGGGSTVSASSATLTQDTAGALDTWEQWGTETVTFSGLAGTPVTVDATLLGNFTVPSAGGRRIAEARVQVSLDGGATFTSGNAPRTEAQPATLYRAFLGSHAVVSGTPTGDVVIRAQLSQVAIGTAGDITFDNGAISARVYS